MDFYIIAEQWINDYRYDVHRYWFSNCIHQQVKFLSKFYKVMMRDEIPDKFKLRKSYHEYSDTALMVFARLDQLCESDIPTVIGSKYLTNKPWAVFGEASHIDSKLLFRDGEDVIHYYEPLVLAGNSESEFFHFRSFSYLPYLLSKKYKTTSRIITGTAICLLYDIIVNCGPDCPEIKDVFINDSRKMSNPDIEEWQDLRCKVMGSKGRIKNKPYKYKVGQVYHPVALESKIEFDLVGEDNLTQGQKTIRMNQIKKSYKQSYHI